LDIKTSLQFKPVDLEGHEPRSVNDVICGLDHTYVITKEGEVYCWGSYSPDEKPVFKPTKMTYFEKYNVLKMGGYSKTYAIVQPKD
jgi:alpha-tubulin suppressor-like RCC1 family protein